MMKKIEKYSLLYDFIWKEIYIFKLNLKVFWVFIWNVFFEID